MPSNSILNIKKDGEWVEIPALKGEDGFSPTATVEKVGKVATITITDINGTTTATIADGTSSGGSGEENTIESISVNGTPISIDENKNVDITVPKVTNDLTDELKSSYDEAVTVKHTHDNKTVLDGITAEKVESWDKTEENVQSDWNETDDTADGFIKNKPTIPDAYDDTDIRAEIAKKADTTAIPSKVSELTNDSNYQTAEQVNSTVTTEIAKVVADAPEDLNTLKEMSDWIAGHEDDASAMNSAISDNKTSITALQTGKADKSEIPTTVAELIDSADYAKTADVNDSISTLQTDKADASDLTAHTDDTDIHVTAENKATWNTVSDKVDKEEGKGLSSNDYTSEEKTKLGGVGTSQGRNLIPYPLTDRTTNGITYTVQSDGSVLANGTASAENNAYYNFAYKTLKLGDTSYTLSCEGLPKSVYVYVYDETISKAVANVSDTPVTKTFVGDSTHTYSLSINVGKGTPVSDLAIKPILEIGTIAHAYEPISESNVNLKDAIDKVSTSQGRNIIPYPYTSKEGTVNGITWTVNDDGTITADGTATNNTFFNLTNYIVGTWDTLHAGTYTIMDGVNLPIGGVTLQVESTTGTQYKNKTFTIEQDVVYKIFIYIPKGTVADNITFKPMLEVGSIAHMYEPTTLSNHTLKKKIESALQPESIVNNQVTTEAGYALDARQANPNVEGSLGAQIKTVNETVDALKKSVSDGKTKVANAITDKGVETATDATFDVMAENISKIETGGGELHGATLAVSTAESTLFGQTVTLTLNGASVASTVFADNGTCSFVVQNPGTYTITCGEAHKDVTVTGDNVVNKTVISVELSLIKIVTFADGTDEEIAAMIEAHYNDKINIADYWAVGDTRNVDLSAMSATGVGESHRAQTVQFVIGDFNHDDLATPINGHTKAAITLLQKDCLMDASNASNPVNGEYNTENGYMNSTNTNVGGWKNCARRTWCNNVFFAALPSVWQSMVKMVNKKSGTGGGSSSGTKNTVDKIFLAAEIEIFGSTTYSFAGEGTQYQYYKNATANRYKMPKWSSSSVSNIYWERSPLGGNTSRFCNAGSGGSAYRNDANDARGVAPCLCI